MSRVTLHRQSVVSFRSGEARRRDFLKAIPLAGAALGALSWPDFLTLQASELRRQGKACILLWMQGGPSQFETFSPKPGHTNGGETTALATSVPGIEISENLPRLAKVMDEVCVIRSMTSSEGSHPRATVLMHTGYLPTASVKHPELGAHVRHQLGDPASDLPGFVRIGQARLQASGGGLLGAQYDPFVISNPGQLPDNASLTTDQQRYERRRGLLERLEEAEEGPARQEVGDHRELYNTASRMILSPKMDAFRLDRESEPMRTAYGSSPFGKGCLLARRLVESGVTFVEVTAGNWDTHDNNFERSRQLCQQIDQPYAALLEDLKQRGMLEKTLVIWMGEFGRTPRVNPRGGRDHYPRAFNVALSGCGVQGGQVIGSTDEGGVDVADRPVKVTDLFRTFCQALNINADHENMSSIGRPIKIVDGGEAVQEVFTG